VCVSVHTHTNEIHGYYKRNRHFHMSYRNQSIIDIVKILTWFFSMSLTRDRYQYDNPIHSNHTRACSTFVT
jgi:hypothetical protein